MLLVAPSNYLKMLSAIIRELSGWDTLSMGMSDDMAEAITNGSTMVRVGTAIFGARD